jgi:hypothetical protein
MKKLLIALAASIGIAESCLAQHVYTVEGQFGYILSNRFLMPHRDRYYDKHPPVPPLAPWYTYWPAEAMNQPIAPMSFPFWPGQNYQAPPANQPGNGQFQNTSGHPNYYYFTAPNQYIYPAR